jgi:putative endonuclease
MTASKWKRKFGQYAEQLAVDYLKRHGYAILTTNWRCSRGEIDIVAQIKDMVVIVEVRARHADSTEIPLATINPRKRTKLIELAFAYLSASSIENAVWRVDVIAIAIPQKGMPIIEHIEDALGW